MNVALDPVSPSDFAPFGDVLDRPAEGLREDFVSEIESTSEDARINVALIRADPFKWAPVTLLERHRFSSQLFVPLEGKDYVVLVADGESEPAWGSCRAFRVGGRQAINYRRGVWHMGMATFSDPGHFLMVIYQNGTERDCDFLRIQPISIVNA